MSRAPRGTLSQFETNDSWRLGIIILEYVHAIREEKKKSMNVKPGHSVYSGKQLTKVLGHNIVECRADQTKQTQTRILEALAKIGAWPHPHDHMTFFHCSTVPS